MKTLTLLSVAAFTPALTNVEDSSCSATTAYAGQSKDIVATAVEAGNFETLAAALGAADLVGALQGDGPFTVFAPTDAAFAKLPADHLASLLEPENKGLLTSILTFHVVPGRVPAKKVVASPYLTTLNGQRIEVKAGEEGVTVDGALVSTTDIECSNGIIHVIDSVILPNTKDIVEVAVEAGSFETLAAALGAAGLVETLQGEGPFTVFAPTDDAFAALPEGTVASLLEPANKAKLVDVLKLHVASGRVYGDQALEAGELTTLQGKTLEARVDDQGDLRVGGARVLKGNVEASNGVIHVIDRVLLP